MSSKNTPMIRQYLAIKKQYPDALLLYRMGDFYEMFFEDAKIASRLLEITLTARNKKDKNPIPLCGVPHRAIQTYIAKLIEKGHKVAVCDQVEDPSKAKGLVKREVVRVVTPGMIIENEFLDAKTNNYVLALTCHKNKTGLAYLDISTGAFQVAESDDLARVMDEVLRVSPSEVLLPESFKKDVSFEGLIQKFSEKSITFLSNKWFDYADGRESLMEQFSTLSLEGFGCEHLKAGVGAAGALLYYVADTQKQKIEHLSGITTYVLSDYLSVDDLSCRNLELAVNLRNGTRQGTLLEITDKTVTSMGGRLFKHWLRYPLLSFEKINARLDAVEAAAKNTGRSIRDALKSVHDLERLGSRIVMGHGNARDLTALKKSLNALPNVFDLTSQLAASLFQWDKNLDPLYDLAELIEKAVREDAPPTLNEGGLIKTGYNSELDELIKISKDGKGWLLKLEAQEKQATGINSLKVRYNKVFGYYLEVPKTHSKKVPAHYVRKQTLVNAERYITDDLKQFEAKVLGAEDRQAILEYELFSEIRENVRSHNTYIQETARFLARLDCLLALAHIAHENNYIRPQINMDGHFTIKDGRHPVIEKMITAERFVPNTIHMDQSKNQILIITGPNMAGKSTVLRQVALTVIMAQMGSFVPAAEASIPITDKVFTRVGALDNLSQGQSTFMVEMQETANILNNATPKSLVIMDEIGRGTSTFDGLSIAWAVAEYLHDLKETGVKTLFATHYHELTELALSKSRVKNYSIAVKEINEEVIFLRKLIEGGTNRSYGIQVARLAGIPPQVIERAKTVLTKVESDHKGLPAKIENPLLQIDLSNQTEQINLFNQQAEQMNLFAETRAENTLINALKTLNIAEMTPLQAINYLNELQEKVKFH